MGAGMKTIKLPYMGAITGPFAAVGLPMGNSTQLAVELSQKKLQQKGIDLQYMPADDQMDAAQTPQVARNIVQDPDVLAIVGPMFGIDLNPAGPIFTQAGVAMLTPGASAAVLSTHGWTMFRMIPNDDTQGTVGANYIRKVLKLSKVAVIDDSTQYGHGVALVVADNFKKNGVTITDMESVSSTPGDYSATISKIITSGATGVFMGGSITTQYTLMRQLRDKGFKGAYVAPDGALNPDFPEKSGPGSEGAIITCQCSPVPTYGGPASGPLADYVAAYRAKFKQEPQAYSPEAFDAANLIISGLLAGKLDRASMLAYIRTVKFKGVANTYSFQSTGELRGTNMNIYKVQNGKIHWLGTSDNLIK
jgi:branched-chain amino acid transport system substrate-binding protein